MEGQPLSFQTQLFSHFQSIPSPAREQQQQQQEQQQQQQQGVLVFSVSIHAN